MFNSRFPGVKTKRLDALFSTPIKVSAIFILSAHAKPLKVIDPHAAIHYENQQ
jgi:hypothetical protein